MSEQRTSRQKATRDSLGLGRLRRIGSRAIDELLSARPSAGVLNSAFNLVQDKRKAFDESGAKLLASLGVATTADLQVLERRLARIRKRIEAVVETLED